MHNNHVGLICCTTAIILFVEIQKVRGNFQTALPRWNWILIVFPSIPDRVISLCSRHLQDIGIDLLMLLVSIEKNMSTACYLHLLCQFFLTDTSSTERSRAKALVTKITDFLKGVRSLNLYEMTSLFLQYFSWSFLKKANLKPNMLQNPPA